MTQHKIGTREEWLAARLELLKAEKELTHRSDELARQRQALPWVRIDKNYRFATEDGTASLHDLFRGRSQLLVHHMMFPGCPSCASVADGYNGFAVHLDNHGVAMACVSRYPIDELTAFKKRMGWNVPYVSSRGSQFNFDFGLAYTAQEMADGPEHNMHLSWDHSGTPANQFPVPEGLPSPNDMPPKDAPGMSAFALEDDIVYHTYSAYARGTDILWGMYQWLDRAPHGRNETGRWYRLRDEYDNRTP
ncbi:DUF899 domain-containing protein [Streptosporangiaceae bacterium NEAU-GS5]|nr:DUF899 domain-containing protein [Streptosporangiaceae bacterium NEAU-GS5]